MRCVSSCTTKYRSASGAIAFQWKLRCLRASTNPTGGRALGCVANLRGRPWMPNARGREQEASPCPRRGNRPPEALRLDALGRTERAGQSEPVKRPLQARGLFERMPCPSRCFEFTLTLPSSTSTSPSEAAIHAHRSHEHEDGSPWMLNYCTGRQTPRREPRPHADDDQAPTALEGAGLNWAAVNCLTLPVSASFIYRACLPQKSAPMRGQRTYGAVPRA